MAKKWQYFNQKRDEDEVKKLEEKFKISKLLSNIMVNRGITEEKAKIFLNPTRNDFYDPYEMPDMEKAVRRILQAIKNKEKTIIYGDYDVDGITSTTILKCFLKERGLECDYYIPNRLKEGYGLNKEAIKKIAEEKYNLIITVDCGVTAVEEVELAKSLGIDKQEITRDASLKDDFAADSVDIYQLIYLLEDEYNVTIPEEKVATVKTVDDLIKMLKELGVED